ncbi:hypothetical protein FB45DRAFT_544882 [Roridomyces roridus]|uniref:Secreted protein n=1 Tax=Roridomyces roridus TaxID=1738132 RepID=A0AAD7FNP7_9AGAR|nr:hypothetical protein FB45DRAFT_544882 [Roridomyces roridus]
MERSNDWWWMMWWISLGPRSLRSSEISCVLCSSSSPHSLPLCTLRPRLALNCYPSRLLSASSAPEVFGRLTRDGE